MKDGGYKEWGNITINRMLLKKGKERAGITNRKKKKVSRSAKSRKCRCARRPILTEAAGDEEAKQ